MGDGIKIDILGTEYDAAGADATCGWVTDGPCGGGGICKMDIFDELLDVPVCVNHAEDHHTMIFLHESGYDVEELSSKSIEWRRQERLAIQNSWLWAVLAKLDELLAKLDEFWFKLTRVGF